MSQVIVNKVEVRCGQTNCGGNTGDEVCGWSLIYEWDFKMMGLCFRPVGTVMVYDECSESGDVQES